MSTQATEHPAEIPDRLGIDERDAGARGMLARFQALRSQVLAGLRAVPALSQLVASHGPDVLLTIQWPAGALDALAKGDVTWKKYADGSLAVMLRGPKGKEIVKHLRLREVSLPPETAAALHNLAVQSALAEIIGRLEDLDAKVERVLSGQRVDRHGRIDGGLHLYEQAMAAAPGSARHLQIANALALLNQGRSQLMAFIEDEANSITAPSAWESLTTLWGETPTTKHTKRMDALAEDAAKCVLATRAIVIIHEEQGDSGSARVAVEQLARVARECAPKLAHAARAVPRKAGGRDPEAIWRFLHRRILPSADAAVRLLGGGGSSPLSLDFSAAELLNMGEGDA